MLPTSNNTSSKLDRDMGLKNPLRILVAEDNIINQKVVLNLLGRLGYQAEIANNGLEVLEALKHKEYDMILMDVQMPEMGGEEATQAIRQNMPAEKQPRIVALTANAMQGDRERFLAVGMNDYLSKPINSDELVRALLASKPIPAGHSPSTVSEAANQRAAVDPSVLLEFKDLMGEEGDEMVRDLVDLYINNSPMLIEQMRRQIIAQRLPELQRAAHTLKGNSNQLGAAPLGDICFLLEKLAKAGSLAGAVELVAQIETEFSRVKVELEKKFLS